SVWGSSEPTGRSTPSMLASARPSLDLQDASSFSSNRSSPGLRISTSESSRLASPSLGSDIGLSRLQDPFSRPPPRSQASAIGVFGGSGEAHRASGSGPGQLGSGRELPCELCKMNHPVPERRVPQLGPDLGIERLASDDDGGIRKRRRLVKRTVLAHEPVSVA